MDGPRPSLSQHELGIRTFGRAHSPCRLRRVVRMISIEGMCEEEAAGIAHSIGCVRRVEGVRGDGSCSACLYRACRLVALWARCQHSVYRERI